MTELAIIGLGAWGLCVLERTVNRARSLTQQVTLHIVQPGALGGGVYSAEQPDYLVLNNACGQLSLYASPDGNESPAYALSLHEWAVTRGYRWVGYECRRDPLGVPIESTDYLPRRLMGEYLAWFYRELVASAPSNIRIVHHDAFAIDVVAVAGGRERVLLEGGESLDVDHVVLTSGHTWNNEALRSGEGIDSRRPYPVDYFSEVVAAGSPVAISGMGLVAFDLVTAMTVGRGGAYTDAPGGRKRYLRSGREPAIYLYSRSGVPYCAKSAHGIDPTGDYEPIVCTPEQFASLRSSSGIPRRQIDFRMDLLPLLFAEMRARYLTHAATLDGGAELSSRVADELRAGWAGNRFDDVVASWSKRYGTFEPESHIFAGAGSQYHSSRDYEAQMYSMVADDLDEALTPGGSPVKAAQEVMRILRDQLRSVIEFGGLTLESYVDFQSNVRGRINRLEAGPPPLRSQQLLALMDSGIVRVPFGPAPELIAGDDGLVTVRSTRLERTHAAKVAVVARGHLDLPSLARSASPLLHRLYTKGRLTQLTYGETPVGSVAINEEFHPFDAEGRVQPHLSLFGVLTEGARYFTHYLPSPRSRLRAVLDAQAWVGSVLG